tara:strand:+ start:295 stop:528 length:234 start_codon:yes stop_codon:yes gene_type:complete
MSKIIDVRKWMPAIRQLAQRKLPMIELRDQLRRERERTSQLIDKLKAVKNTTVQKLIKEYENKETKPLLGENGDHSN